MNPKFHYEVETMFDPENDELTINSFYHQDPLVARQQAFLFLKNYLLILQEDKQVNSAGIEMNWAVKFLLKQREVDQTMLYHFMDQLTFKTPNFNQGLKVVLVIDEEMEIDEKVLYINDRFPIFQLGNYTDKSLIEMIVGLQTEHAIHAEIDHFVYRHSEAIKLTPIQYLLKDKAFNAASIDIIRTPVNFEHAHWSHLFSVFNHENTFSYRKIKETYIDGWEEDFVQLDNFDMKQVFKEASSLYHTYGGLLSLKINTLETEEATQQLVQHFIHFLSKKRTDQKLSTIPYRLISCQNNKGEHYLCLLIEAFKWEENPHLKLPSKMYYREGSDRKSITDANEMIEYLMQHF